MPSSIAEEIAIVDGQLFARLSHTPNVRTTTSTHPIVRFEDGKLVTVLSDTRYGCSSQRIECMASDGKTLFVKTAVGDKETGQSAIIKRVGRDGAPGKDILVPDDGYGFPQMAAYDGRVLIRGITGPTALFGQDGKVTRLTELRYGEWPILATNHVFLSNIHAISRVTVGSGTATVGEVDSLGSSRIDTIAADDRFVYALTGTGQQFVPTVHRFPREGSDARPEKSETISAEALARLNAASINVTEAMARTVGERAAAHDGRVYFTITVMTPEGTAQNRVIVEWSVERSFRPIAAIKPWQGEWGTRLVVGNRRLYWIEQPSVSDNERPAWRILSVPL